MPDRPRLSSTRTRRRGVRDPVTARGEVTVAMGRQGQTVASRILAEGLLTFLHRRKTPRA